MRPVFQLLSYPMLDDRTTQRTDIDERYLRGWDATSNRHGWTAYLGATPGTDGISGRAAPASHEDLAGLPRAWIGIGTLDLFHDEDLAYAARLQAADVSCQVSVVEGAFHGFDAARPRAPTTAQFRADQVRALGAALSP